MIWLMCARSPARDATHGLPVSLTRGSRWYAPAVRPALRPLGSVARRLGLGVALLAAAGWVLGTSGVASAEERVPGRIVFVLHDQSPASGVLQTFDRLQGQLGELQIDIQTVHVAPLEEFPDQARQAARIARESRAVAAVWFEAGTADTLRIYALHAPSGRVFARDVTLGDDATVQREQLAVVLRAAVPAVLSGGSELGTPLLVVAQDSPVETSPPSPPSSPKPAERAPREVEQPARLRTGVGYGGTSVAHDASWQSGVLAELLLDAGGWLRGSLGAGYAASTTIRGDQADAIITRFPFVARAGAMRTFGGAGFGVEAGPVLEAWRRRTAVHSDQLQPTEPSTAWRYGGAVAARLEVSLGPRVGLYLLLEGQWFPGPHTLTIESEQGEQRITTRSLRPELGLGLLFDVLRPLPPTKNVLPWQTQAGTNERNR